MLELDCKTRPLNRIHAAIPTDNCVMVFPCLTVIPQYPNLVGEFEIIRHNGASLAQRAEVFSRIKTKTSDFADRTSSSPFVFSPVGLSRVFDNRNAMLPAELHNRIHIGRLTEEMNGNDRLCPAR